MKGSGVRRASFGVLLLAILLSGCGSEELQLRTPPTLTPYPDDIYIGLSEAASTLADLVSSPYEAESDRPAPRFTAGNDETLLADLEQGIFEAVIVHQLPADSPHWFSPVGLDGVVFLVDPELGVEGLSESQIQGIFGGSIVNWQSVGGPSLAIRVYIREPGSGARAVLRERILGNMPYSSLAQIAPDDEFMRQAVATNPGAIGYSMMSSGDEQSLVLYEGRTATPDSVGEQLYPLTTPVYFVSKSEPEGDLREFLAWLQSPDGQNVLGEKYGQVR